MYDEAWPYFIIIAVLVFSALLLLYTMRGRSKTEKEPVEAPEAVDTLTRRPGFGVSPGKVKTVRADLRMISIEREILSYAIRHLYEAQVEGKISEGERDRLAEQYKGRMMIIKEAISRNESIIALHELESMRGDLIKLFNERFEEINTKIDSVRERVGIKTEIEAPAPSQLPTEKEETKRVRRPRAPPPRKTETEKRIDEIRSEVEKVLERLGQIEIEE